MDKEFKYVYRVRHQTTGKYRRNYSTGRVFWTRRSDAERVADVSKETEVVKFKLVEVSEDE